MKKTLLCLAAFGLIFCAAPTYAAALNNTATPQQNRMKNCAAQYHTKKIPKSQYHAFMSQCLKTPPMAGTAPSK